MSAPAGWYPDPQQTVPGAPPQQRYWDGQAWTQHVAPIAGQPTSGQPTYGQPTYGQPASQPTYGQSTHVQQPGAYGGQPAPLTTPDGVRLAGWWHRVGAYVIDGLILSVIVAVLAFPFIRDVFNAFGDFFDQTMTALENGSPTPSSARFEMDIAGAALAIAAIGLAVNLIYTIGFLMWKQATPGKLAVGLRIRLRESPDLPLSAVLLRWATQSAIPGLVGLVPLLGFVGGIFNFLDALWPLWDDKNQAHHDKVAKTNVIRVR
ncbi:MAG: RDD family protein [Marmoricola sp.]